MTNMLNVKFIESFVWNKIYFHTRIYMDKIILLSLCRAHLYTFLYWEWESPFSSYYVIHFFSISTKIHNKYGLLERTMFYTGESLFWYIFAFSNVIETPLISYKIWILKSCRPKMFESFIMWLIIECNKITRTKDKRV